MSEQAVKEWPDLWIRRDESVDEYFEDPWKIWGAAINDDTPYDLTSTRRYVPQQRVNALVEALEEIVAGSDELFATNRAKALRTATVNARTALANYKEGEA